MGSRGVKLLAGLHWVGTWKGSSSKGLREEGEWFQDCADDELGGWRLCKGWSEKRPKESGWH
jgi:hypothetical protein